MVRSTVSFLIVMACVQAALAQQRDPTPGRRLAERECASCHAVKPGEIEGSPLRTAPPFQLVARMASTTELALRVFLRTSHAGMPNLQFNEQEIDDLVAYITSLSPPGR